MKEYADDEHHDDEYDDEYLEEDYAITKEERGLAVLAHLSGLASYVIPLGGIVAPIVIMVVKSDTPIISNLAKQALLLNIAVYFLGIVCALLFLTVILIPVAIAGWIVLFLAAVGLPIVGAVRASEGIYYRYPLIGATID